MCISELLTTAFLCLSQATHFSPVHDALEFDEPVQVLFDGTNKTHAYVVEKKGIIQRVSIENKEATPEVFLNITDRVVVGHSEEGLLSLAFHPNYNENKRLFVWYTSHGPRRCVLSSFTTTNTNNIADPTTEEIILELLQPWGNHNGGMVLFGGDGYLYLGIGDGGGSNDTKENGQNKKTLLGTIIRIDINATSGEKKYAIPSDNPFSSSPDARGEIWAYGLRNPWRMSFDSKTGKLWVADVGQNKWEEINIVEKGKNYGWNLREGKHDFMDNNNNGEQTVDPVFEYGRRHGGSITGGYVYRGNGIPGLYGEYIYADYLNGRVWRLLPPSGEIKKYKAKRILNRPPLSISSFGETPNGEVLACGFKSPYATKGRIYRLVSKSEIDSSDSSSMTDKMR